MSAPGSAVDALRQPLDRLPDPLPVPPLTRPFDVTITPPGSKSMTNRALLLAALASGESTLRGALTDADDAAVMIRALRALGAGVEIEGRAVRVRGVGGRFAARTATGAPLVLNLENAGTATRFLAAAALLADGPVVIDGNARMRQRPIGELADALAALGAKVEWLGARGCPPLRVTAAGRAGDGAAMREITLPTTSSGQFVSALLLVAPFLPGGLCVRIEGEPTSPPYIEMTLRMVRYLGADATWDDELREMRVSTPRAALGAFELDIEPDASGATYFWAAAALIPGASCTTRGLGIASLQGDAQFGDPLERMGAMVRQEVEEETGVRGGASLGPVEVDCTDMPDAALTLATLACFASGVSTISGLRTLRVKETDRLAALQTELTKLGVRVEIVGDADDPALRITPPTGGVDCSAGAAPIVFGTYDDHRMAMALALVGLRRPNVSIRNPACVAKTYPGFWGDLAKLY